MVFALVKRGLDTLAHGRLLLHASPLGGPGLLAWYPSNAYISPQRPNDGRYL